MNCSLNYFFATSVLLLITAPEDTAMPTSDDRFDRLERLIDSRFVEMRRELRSELQEDMRDSFQDMRSELRGELQSEIRIAVRTEMAPAFAVVNKRIDGLAAQLVDFRNDLVGRVDTLASWVHLTDQGHLKMSNRLSNLEQRVDRIESTSIFQSPQS